MIVKYCNAACQRNHWPKHKQLCKQRAAELRDEALFKDPPPKEDCPICFLPMPHQLIACVSLPPATITSVPIYDYAMANEGLASKATEQYYSCCGKSICRGCIYSFNKSGNDDKCPFCNSDRADKTDEEEIEELMKRVEANDASSIYVLGNCYHHGQLGLLQDRTKAIELWKQAAELGSSRSHFQLGTFYDEGGDLKKAKIHYEAAATAGHEGARCNLGKMEYKSGNMEQAVKHSIIAASVGDCYAMYNLLVDFEEGLVGRVVIDSTLTAYNNSCVEMRSEARDAYIRVAMEMNEST
jgi:TPR repeat protein